MIKEATGKVVLKKDLTEEEMRKVMEEITTGSASDAQIASFITALRMKEETPEEVTVAARSIKEKVSTIHGGQD
ncbi:MAG: anthranilate phosphoribosyltransferase, partial [Thermodesulfobacteriota bacterium]